MVGGCDVLTFLQKKDNKANDNLNTRKQARNAAKPWLMKGKCL